MIYMPKTESDFATNDLKEKYAQAINGGVGSFFSRDGMESEDNLPKELSIQTPGAFVVLLRESVGSNQEGIMEVLLVQRKDYEGLWNLPGGGIDKSETFATGAIREVEEETGLVVKLVEGTAMVHHAGVIDEESEYAGERRYDRFSGAIGVIQGGELKLNEEAAAIKWFPIKELPEKMYLKHRLLIHSYFIPPYFYELKKEIFFAAQNHSFIPKGIS